MTDENIEIINIPLHIPVAAIKLGAIQLFATAKGWTATINQEVTDETAPTGTRSETIENPISALDYAIGAIQKAVAEDFQNIYSTYVMSQAQLKVDADLKNMGLK